jgi:hypothetical protein
MVHRHRFQGPSHCLFPHSCEVRAKETVSVDHSGWGHGIVCYHSEAYHSQEVSIGRVTKHGLGLAGSASFFDLMLHAALQVPPCRLDKQHLSLHKGQCNFGFQFAEIKVWHSLAVVLDDDVTLVGMDEELPAKASGVVHNRPDLLKDLEGDDGGHSAFIQPHLCDGSHFSGAVHPAGSCVTVSDKTSCLLPHVLKEIGVRCA